ncbi:hypothetical protein KJ611_03120 [Patescibacteria group bacterium]|nr:hypothetical protein [Patescibacteria group bacterium]MBU1705379.1 hypothetical protein [Patescibacteria group bacterium]
MPVPNLTLPLTAFLILYGIFICIYALYTFFNAYHLIKFGLIGRTTRSIIVVQAGLSLILLIVSLFLVTYQDWTVTWNLTEIFQRDAEQIFPAL